MGLAHYVLVDSRAPWSPLGALDPMVAGPLTDAGATSYHAVKRVLPKLVPGSTAVVIGAGGLGGFAVQFLAKLSPARVVAVDVSPRPPRLRTGDGGPRRARGRRRLDDATASRADARRRCRHSARLRGDRHDDRRGPRVGAQGRRRSRSSVPAAARSGDRGSAGCPNEADIFCFQGSSISDARDVLSLAAGGLVRTEIDLFPFSRVQEAYEQLDAGRLRGRAVVTPDG